MTKCKCKCDYTILNTTLHTHSYVYQHFDNGKSAIPGYTNCEQQNAMSLIRMSKNNNPMNLSSVHYNSKKGV